MRHVKNGAKKIKPDCNLNDFNNVHNTCKCRFH